MSTQNSIYKKITINNRRGVQGLLCEDGTEIFISTFDTPAGYLNSDARKARYNFQVLGGHENNGVFLERIVQEINLHGGLAKVLWTMF